MRNHTHSAPQRQEGEDQGPFRILVGTGVGLRTRRYPLPIEEDKGDIVSVCDGDVEAGIFLEWEPFYGGCDPRVDIRWKCDKCGFEHGHPELPTSMDDLSMLVTELLSHADSKILEKMKQDHMEYILSHERRMAEFVQEEEAQRKRNARPLPG